jgi:hypothetical protein
MLVETFLVYQHTQHCEIVMFVSQELVALPHMSLTDYNSLELRGVTLNAITVSIQHDIFNVQFKFNIYLLHNNSR